MNLAYCGDDCEECPRYKATVFGSKKELREVVLLMKRVGWPYNLKNIEKMRCRGCQDIENCEYGIKSCCIEKKVNHCGECPQYVCKKIQQALDITKENRIKFKEILTKKEYEMFRKAFFEKKQNLENYKHKDKEK